MVKGNKPCLIACGIFREELGRIIHNNGFKADTEYINPGLHNEPKNLEKALSKAIERKKKRYQDNIVVVYGDVCLGFQNDYAGVIDQISEFTGLPVVERKDIGLEGIRKTIVEAMEQIN